MSGFGPVEPDNHPHPDVGAGATTRRLRVRPFRPGETPPAEPEGDPSGGARPRLWLGAEAVGGLALPDAKPTPGHLYAPRGVWLDDRRLIAADTGNHRILIWHTPDALVSSHASHTEAALSSACHSEADVVLGQPDFTTEGAQAGGRGPEAGMRLPTGILVHDGRLVVADSWNHRILIWDRVPTTSDVAPDVILGQADAGGVDANRDGTCGPLTFYWPFGVAVIDGVFYVADTGNRRVLAWNGIPDPDREPDVVLGQPSAHERDENRGGLGPKSFRWPHALAGTSDLVLAADAGNHRLLGWRPRPDRDRDADLVIGQHDFTTAGEFPYAPQTADILRFPYALAVDTAVQPDGDPASRPAPPPLAVADTANNRVLVWDRLPDQTGAPADRVLGQPSFAANGENRWEAVTADTFCWPYGLCLHRGRLAVADSGNNRITVWDLQPG